MDSGARKFAEDNWRQLVLKHTNGGACNFQAAAAELAALVEAAERERCLNEWNGLLLELRQMADDSADRGDVFAQRVVALLSRA